MEPELGLDRLAQLVDGQRGHGLGELRYQAAGLIRREAAEVTASGRAAGVLGGGLGDGREVLPGDDARPDLVGLVLGGHQDVAHAGLPELVLMGVVVGAYGCVVDLGGRQRQAERGDLRGSSHDLVAVGARKTRELAGVGERALHLGESATKVEAQVTPHHLVVHELQEDPP